MRHRVASYDESKSDFALIFIEVTAMNNQDVTITKVPDVTSIRRVAVVFRSCLL